MTPTFLFYYIIAATSPMMPKIPSSPSLVNVFETPFLVVGVAVGELDDPGEFDVGVGLAVVEIFPPPAPPPPKVVLGTLVEDVLEAEEAVVDVCEVFEPVLPPMMWNGSDHWKILEFESRVILMP